MPNGEQQARIERGQAAKRFLDYYNTDPYYKSVMKQIEDDIMLEMMGLNPVDVTRWAHLQVSRMVLYSPVQRIYADYEIGQRALAESEEPRTKEGIL
jgi:hypothetical protein